MKKNLFYLFMGFLLLSSCIRHENYMGQEISKESIDTNARNVFGVVFDSTHDWCTTTSSEVLITDIPSDIEKVQLLVHISDNDTTSSVLIVNEAKTNGKSSISLSYDIPIDNLGLYASFISKKSYIVRPIVDNSVSYNENYNSRVSRASSNYALPTITPTIESTVESYASQRGWLEGQVLYCYNNQTIEATDYSDEYKTTLKAIIFSYFKNGRQYNNLPLIINSGYYNESGYLLTTGGRPVIVSPIYKSDKAKQYGNEVWNSDLYYYYYKESDLVGKNEVDFLNSLPKYKAIEFKNHFGETEDDVVSKRASYALVYWGDGTPEIGKEGSYYFPKGYKIGFMIRAKTDFKENGKPRKQGELYGDGRLNNNINNYSECNFKTSKLGNDGPRMGWININEKMFLCCESGTDSDFNDIIIEVDGGVENILNVLDFDNNYYTFCFEDTKVGDYDMNDIVIKARRVDETTVEYKVVACGAFDKIKIMNINGETINSNVEVHNMFGVDGGFINTVEGEHFDAIVDHVKVDKTFSFLDEDTQPYIYDITTNKVIKLAKKGENPYGIMIPYDFKYPIERVCIKDAYSEFNSWGENKITSTYWYKRPNENLVYKQ